MGAHSELGTDEFGRGCSSRFQGFVHQHCVRNCLRISKEPHEAASRDKNAFIKTAEALNMKFERRAWISNLSEVLAHPQALDMCAKPA